VAQFCVTVVWADAGVAVTSAAVPSPATPMSAAAPMAPKWVIFSLNVRMEPSPIIGCCVKNAGPDCSGRLVRVWWRLPIIEGSPVPHGLPPCHTVHAAGHIPTAPNCASWGQPTLGSRDRQGSRHQKDCRGALGHQPATPRGIRPRCECSSTRCLDPIQPAPPCSTATGGHCSSGWHRLNPLEGRPTPGPGCPRARRTDSGPEGV
jgi:hypothetical protein